MCCNMMNEISQNKKKSFCILREECLKNYLRLTSIENHKVNNYPYYFTLFNLQFLHAPLFFVTSTILLNPKKSLV